ncbi:hypothetical protein KP003_11585 [Geomonas nitrogeniifigens]|uniref:hypothetical protein n=1 Tax=Geomonas diazotrophica TaxID=2843197 RepID=UPI001C2B8B85|nr:hypothetical protein [Geomonas nitrogeniifigens]QXE85040.1 hypothetical protein KP003_11585 [Geomonas nitrogeniifigens]
MRGGALTISLLALTVVAVSCGDAHAYIDPNTGGYVFQVLFPIVSAVAAAFVFCRDGVVKLLRRIFRRPEK